ncbi:MAG TPA: PQQ-dependent sugar dehydrogenase [Pyrinomonadaceae bacterium]|nr:PQQ-dependent sugar dehydrogenase [Pyrinomonadaceae bacterium]
MLRFEQIRFIVLPALLAALLGFLLSNNTSTPVHAFSSGPPPGYTGAPGEEPSACAECHVPADAGTGHISITAPSTYIPGQTYPITVTHSNIDPTRIRWGFELTALDTSDEQAGNLQSLDGLTQVLNNAGPGGARQYIEHTSAGTFIGQQNTASWTFNWTAPSTDIGPVTFYAAGNQANNDGNTSGDYIYKTFVAAAPLSATPGFVVLVSPALRTVVPGGTAQYSVTITPLAGFTGSVTLGTSALPTGANGSFSPGSISIADANSQTSTLSVTTALNTPLGSQQFDITGELGPTMHSTQATLQVVSPTSADVSVTKTASPNPGQVGVPLSYRIVATNNGPAIATNVVVTDTLPAGVTFGSASSSQGSCVGTGTVTCGVGSLAPATNAIVTIVVTPISQGQLVNTASIGANESDFDSSNNSATATISVQPSAVSPTMMDANLTVSTVFTGLNQPTSMAFLGANDFLILEKTTGKVQRIVNGALQSTVLDLAVNSASERGLLGIALHPKFSQNGFVYLYWTESTSGVDSANPDDVPVLGNRVDRYIWNGTTLTFDRNLIKLRALQQDAGQQSRGNHNGGVLRFGPDGKLYVIIGDNGRRGLLQNITSGGPVPDDQFGGPEPDNAHLTGVVLRLNDDGSTPADNPFFNANTTLTSEAASNVKKIFGYGVRNGFGMAFDPLSGALWTQENGDDAFDEMNRVVAGFNGGWIETMGPLARIDQFKSIESTYGAGNLQQLRWPPSNIADTPQQALARMFMLPGAQYVDPEFSWKYATAPAGIGFIKGRGLGPQYDGDLLVGASRTTLLNGFLFRFKFTPDRQHFAFTDSRLADRVADNVDKFDQTESESLVIGRDFGVVTDIQTGPNGNVYAVSLSNGAVYEIKSKPTLLFTATLDGTQETPANPSTAIGTAALLLSPDETTARVSLNFSGLGSAQTAAHIHGPAAVGVPGSILFPLLNGQVSDFEIALVPGQAADLKNGLWYINVHSTNFPNGEIRGQFQSLPATSSVQFNATKYVVNEGEGGLALTVNRLGNTSGPASVEYATSDTAGTNPCSSITGAASSRCDYLNTVGTLSFSAGETSKTISIPITDDSFAEGAENFTISLSNPSGATLGPPSSAQVTINDNDAANGPNPIDTVDFFVRQHYIDFLNREPDPPGFGFWTHDIDLCGTNQQCIEVKRVNVSAAFFLSIEFQETGYFVYRTHKAAFGNLPGAPVPVRFLDFLKETQQIGKGVQVGVGNWEAQLEANKQAYILSIIQGPDFLAAFPNSMTAQGFVDKLDINAGQVLSVAKKAGLVAVLGSTPSDINKRAQVLRSVADDDDLRNAEFNRAFVLMQYFGYLRRNPNDLPDSDFSGYGFWLNKLDSFSGNFVNAEMVRAFIQSIEYKQRFGPTN